MTYIVRHSYVDQDVPVTLSTQDDSARVHGSTSGRFAVRFPGKLHIVQGATYTVRTFVEDVDQPGREPEREPRGRWVAQTRSLPLTVEIKTPDGQPFTADHVTLSDLGRFRDLRGTSEGSWSFSVSGESESLSVDPQ